jgi:hypothetical protein
MPRPVLISARAVLLLASAAGCYGTPRSDLPHAGTSSARSGGASGSAEAGPDARGRQRSFRDAAVPSAVTVRLPVDESGRWPSVEPGVWELREARTLASGKTLQWRERVRHCTDPTELFRGYWGPGVLDRAGCRYRSNEIQPGTFKVTSECMVRNAGVAMSDATVVVTDSKTFTMKISITEGKRRYGAEQEGRRTSSCLDPSTGNAR